MIEDSKPLIDLISLENESSAELVVFIKDRSGRHVDPKFVAVLKYRDKDVLYLPSQDARDGGNSGSYFPYYPARDECAVKKIGTGVYLLNIPKEQVNSSHNTKPEKIVFIIEYNNRVFEIEKVLHE